MTTIEFTETDPDYYGNIRLRQEDRVMNDNDADDNIVAIRNVHKTYLLGVEGIPALRGVSLTIKRGEFVVIFGTSGGGKTTMLNLIGTIDKPTKGDMRLCGKRITEKTPDSDLAELRLNSLGFVFQTFNLLSALTAQENVEMPMVLAGRMTSAERKQRAKALLKKVGLGKRLDHFPSMLSGGEQQRVTIARAIANRPELLLLDEPTGDLDSYNSAIVLQMLCSLHEKGMTLVMVTHDVHLKMFADRVVWMRDGKIQRIEVVSEQQKKVARDNLRAELADFRAARKGSGGDGSDGGDEESTAAAREARRTVEVRRPSDYETSVEFSGSSHAVQLRFDEFAGGKIPQDPQQLAAMLHSRAAEPTSRSSGKTGGGGGGTKKNRRRLTNPRSAAAAAVVPQPQDDGTGGDSSDGVDEHENAEDDSLVVKRRGQRKKRSNQDAYLIDISKEV